mmetsp:Transcript_17544/g.28394  ORF Transcript_17544/g.28394 Transcript_17544/m.28394 type:complete len:343 (-) Transcript_17544:4492-5520(-)
MLLKVMLGSVLVTLVVLQWRINGLSNMVRERRSYLPCRGVTCLGSDIRIFEQYCEEIRRREAPLRLGIVKNIRKLVLEVLPQARVQFFGSSALGLSLPNADLDFSIIFENRLPPGKDEVYKFSRAMQGSRLLDAKTQTITIYGEIPVITQYSISSGMERPLRVDISLPPKPQAKMNNKVIKRLCAEFPALTPMVLVIKQLLKVRSLGTQPGTQGGLTSYAVLVLIAAFLKHNSLLVSSQKHVNDLELGYLLLNFFEFHGNTDFFNPETTTVSMLDGYTKKIDTNITRGGIFIENPGVPGLNLAIRCTKIETIQKVWKETGALLRSKLNKRYPAGYLRKILNL